MYSANLWFRSCKSDFSPTRHDTSWFPLPQHFE